MNIISTHASDLRLLVSTAALLAALAVLVMRLLKGGSAAGGRVPPMSARVGAVMLALFAFTTVATVVGTPRFGVDGPLSGVSLLPLKLLLAAILAATLACAVFCGLDRGSIRVERSVAVTVLPFAGVWAVSAAFGSGRGLDSQTWIAWGVFATLACLPVEGSTLVRQARTLLRFLMWGSLTAAALSPAWAFAPYEVAAGGWLGHAPRLQGLMPDPNPLGWTAAFAVVLERDAAKKTTAKLARSAPAFACLVLSGSRMAIFALVIGFCICASYRDKGTAPPSRSGLRVYRGVALSAAALAIYLVGDDSPQGETFNGRTDRWSGAFTTWLANPLFGTGPDAYSNGHNQVLHTAAELGLVGLISLAWLTVRALRCSFRSPVRGSRVLLTVLVTLYPTENPLRFTTPAYLLPLLPPLLAMVAAQHTRRPSRALTPVGRPLPDRRGCTVGAELVS
ncbi:O-antigen ligase family protein [Streptomyces mirabilis]|uniref:O-antigen ligase family protein n=1 Tax=Streptomyces mirabilis TaxID=68239 RepID=UPI001E324F5E|nr:O-antigen ligase family protein [Streptomyces mirabilis]